MTITLDLPPDTEASLVEQAKASGMSLEAYVASIVATQVATREPVESDRLRSEDTEELISEIFDLVELPPGVGEGAMKRENWYR